MFNHQKWQTKNFDSTHTHSKEPTVINKSKEYYYLTRCQIEFIIVLEYLLNFAEPEEKKPDK